MCGGYMDHGCIAVYEGHVALLNVIFVTCRESFDVTCKTW